MENKKAILKFQILSAILVMILGTLLHFTFKWSNNNKIVALFSSVNESTWEHLKLLFFPMLLTTIIGYFVIGKNFSNFLCSKVLGIIVAILFTTIFFYTYTGILGTTNTILNIGSFFVAVILGEYVAYKKIISNLSCNKFPTILVLAVLTLCFFIFTFFPPKIGLFKDPVFNIFGIY